MANENEIEIEEDDDPNAIPDEKANIMQRVLWVRDRVVRLGKDSQVNNQYKAISHDKVTAFIRPKMVQAGIFSYVTCIKSKDAETGAVNDKGRRIVQHRATFKIYFINAYNSDDWFAVKQTAYADDYGDKAPGKASSYAMKYALLKTFMIETGEEDEERVADGGRGAVIADDEKMTADIWAVAEELFGEDDAKIMLKAMAERRFFVPSYGEIPQERFADAIRSLRVKAAASDKKEKSDDA